MQDFILECLQSHNDVSAIYAEIFNIAFCLRLWCTRLKHRYFWTAANLVAEKN
jgi:hypothetical protein